MRMPTYDTRPLVRPHTATRTALSNQITGLSAEVEQLSAALHALRTERRPPQQQSAEQLEHANNIGAHGDGDESMQLAAWPAGGCRA